MCWTHGADTSTSLVTSVGGCIETYSRGVTMTDHQTVVRDYDELATHAFLKASEADAVARELSDIGHRADWEVVVVEEWLVDEKDVESVPGYYRVFTGRIERETEQAILLSQGQGESWLPKSCSRSFVLAHDVDSVETPQQGLDAFERGGEA